MCFFFDCANRRIDAFSALLCSQLQLCLSTVDSWRNFRFFLFYSMIVVWNFVYLLLNVGETGVAYHALLWLQFQLCISTVGYWRNFRFFPCFSMFAASTLCIRCWLLKKLLFLPFFFNVCSFKFVYLLLTVGETCVAYHAGCPVISNQKIQHFLRKTSYFSSIFYLNNYMFFQYTC